MAAVEYVKQGRIAIITINRPEAMNAINNDVHREFRGALIDFNKDDNLWVAILTGAGDRAFCAGADIKEFKPGPLETSRPAGEFISGDAVKKPIIAAIHGYCLGGGEEIALECDLRIAADDSKFGQPEVNVGYLAAGGGTQRLPRFIPRAVAMDILMTGRLLNAEEALRWGLVSRVVPREKLMEAAMEMAKAIVARSPLSESCTKRAVLEGFNLNMPEAMQVEKKYANITRASEDFVEGPKAFVEKRPPQWKGK
ncbi:MAG: enoyl-CoA hydratase-related protein [Dehalococcoidales bacterium]|nr:enoyl-CoA hydratase-related protein [Dehalococcoidales bacterium]